MNFTITISGEGQELSEALKSLRTVMDGHKITEGVVQASITPSEPKKKQREAEDKSVNVDKTAAEVQQEAEGKSERSSNDEPVPTDVELRAVAAEIGKKGADAKKAIKALLDKFGVPNITAVPAEERAAFKRELEAL